MSILPASWEEKYLAQIADGRIKYPRIDSEYGPMIPLREAVRVVVEACMSERRRCEGDYYGDMYGGAAIDGVEENAIAALQALGGGDEYN